MESLSGHSLEQVEVSSKFLQNYSVATQASGLIDVEDNPKHIARTVSDVIESVEGNRTLSLTLSQCASHV